ncbi:hypothetical protein ASPVEDRAFT_37528, partial [Aspergillus versicolor CBS 583.65]
MTADIADIDGVAADSCRALLSHHDGCFLSTYGRKNPKGMRPTQMVAQPSSVLDGLVRGSMPGDTRLDSPAYLGPTRPTLNASSPPSSPSQLPILPYPR